MTDSPKPDRLQSLDVFRGGTIAGMILVNNPGTWGAMYGPLKHAEWHGLTPTDLVFPFFLFIMGVSMAFSFAKRQSVSSVVLWQQIITRTVLLFAFGFGLSMWGWTLRYIQAPEGTPPPWENLRIFGVLQRISLCFFLAAIAMVFLRTRGIIITAVTLLLGYWAAMRFIPVPGFAPGTLAFPGNLASHLDQLILGTHAYKKIEIENVLYFHDPEGLLSTLPATANVLLGCLAGRWLREPNRDGNEKVAGLAVAAFACIAVSAFWHYEFPINKEIWTSSFTLMTSGLAMLTLAASYWLIDVRKIRTGTEPLHWLGMNPITAFVAASLYGSFSAIYRFMPANDPADPTKLIGLKTWMYNNLFLSWMPDLIGPLGTSFAYAVCTLVVFTMLAGVMYRNRIFLKV